MNRGIKGLVAVSVYNLDYINDKAFKGKLKEALSDKPLEFENVSVCEVDKATILPGKPDPDPSHTVPWGMGGVLDESLNFVEESGVVRAFGGKYEFSADDVEELDEEVIHINVIPRHWGHFLVDVVSRLWYMTDNPDDTRKITYCGWKLNDDGIDGNFLAFLEGIGIQKERLIYIKKPLRVRKAIIPDRTFEYSGKFHEKYRATIQKLIENSINSKIQGAEGYPECIYLTRRQLKKSKYYDTGEKEIEKAFRENGFSIIATEKMSLSEQIRYFQNAKIIASLSGTLPHNIVFTSEQTEFLILKRTAAVLPPQTGFNNLFNRRITYIDVYNPRTIKDHASHGDGPFWVECNQGLSGWFRNNGFKFCEATSKNPFVIARNYITYQGLKFARKVYGLIKR